jgi:hypothetical protein
VAESVAEPLRARSYIGKDRAWCRREDSLVTSRHGASALVVGVLGDLCGECEGGLKGRAGRSQYSTIEGAMNNIELISASNVFDTTKKIDLKKLYMN